MSNPEPPLAAPSDRPATSKEKGDVVEEIVALIHRSPELSVQKKVWLPTVDGTGKREIDVLLTGSLAGYEIRIPIECKNYGRKIERKDIDAYVGKLTDLGLPLQHGIYVTTGQYTKGALKRARAADIRALVLKGLTPDRLAAAVHSALQSVIYLLPVMDSLSFFNDVPTAMDAGLLRFFNDAGETFTLPDLLWGNWCAGRYPQSVGQHFIQVQLPEGFYQVHEGTKVAGYIGVALMLGVRALVVQIPGSAQEYGLIDASTSAIQKVKTTASFDFTRKELPVHVFKTEGELESFLGSRTDPYTLTVGRIPLPRIMTPKLAFWPPGQRLMDQINRLVRDRGADNIDWAKLDVSAMQGPDILTAAFDTIWEGHPAAERPLGDPKKP